MRDNPQIRALAAQLVVAVCSPAMAEAYRDLERIRVQAKAVKLDKEFERAWAYEQARCLELPGQMATPKQVFSLVLKLF